MTLKLNIRQLGLIILLLAFCTGFTLPGKQHIDLIAGAWQFNDGTIEHILIFTDTYFSYTSYDKSNKVFLGSQGGTFKIQGDNLVSNLEFDAMQKDKVGESEQYPFALNDDHLTIEISGKKITPSRIDNGSGDLAGVWVITGRMQGDSMIAITPGSRKTLKIMSGSRFQWAAINTETKEFFGTGGGTYTFKDGKYSESIEFFSRDGSRVGKSLTFDGKLVDGKWHHSGLSSRGEKIHEIWSRLQ